MTDRDDEELAALADELADVLRELRDELRTSRESPEASTDQGLDLPSPPSPDELLAFADERLVPAAIAVLEANVRTLELLQGAVRIARADRPDRAGEDAGAVRTRAESLSRSTLRRLDAVLADLQTAATEGALPREETAREVLTEARRLRDEIDAALAERGAEPADLEDAGSVGAGSTDTEPGGDEDDTGPGDETDADDGVAYGLGDLPEVDVDVEDELDAIRAELGRGEDEDGAESEVASDETIRESDDDGNAVTESGMEEGGDGHDATTGDSDGR